MTILFSQIQWLEYYNGEEKENLSSVDENIAYNFQDYNGFCYGGMNDLPKINTDKLEDVTVVFIAKDQYEEQPVVVGWYQHATIYANEQVEHDKYAIGRELRYFAKAESKNCVLLDTEDRNLVISPNAKNDPVFLSGLLDYIDANSQNYVNLRYTEEAISRVIKDPGLNYEELMEAGDDAVEEEDYYRALIFYNTAFQKQKNIDAIFNIAAMLESLFCFDQAIQVFEKLRELEGNEPDTLDNLLNLYMQTKRYQEALKICHLSVKIAQEDEDTEEICSLLCVEADAYVGLGEKEKALRCLDFIMEHSHDDLMKEQSHLCKHRLEE